MRFFPQNSAFSLSFEVCFVVPLMVAMACNPQESLPESEAGDDVKQQASDAGTITRGTDTSRAITTPQPDVVVDPDTGPEWTYATCPQLLSCAQAQCGTSADLGCEKGCVAKSKADAAVQLQDYAGCMDDVCRSIVCKDDKSSACIATCSAQRCTPMLLPCLSAKKSGSNGCSVLFKAEDGCAKAQDSFKCLASAYDTLAPTQQAAWLAMRKCLAASVAIDRWSDCLKPVLACASDAKIGPKSCVGVVDCAEACGKAEHLYLCIGGCLGNGTKSAQEHFLALRKCVFDSDTAPADGSCYQSLGTCAAPSGKATCDATWKCTNACKGKGGKSALACAAGCLESANKDAAKAFVEFWGCREGVCMPKCEGDKKCFDACVSQTCGTKQATCTKS